MAMPARMSATAVTIFAGRMRRRKPVILSTTLFNDHGIFINARLLAATKYCIAGKLLTLINIFYGIKITFINLSALCESGNRIFIRNGMYHVIADAVLFHEGCRFRYGKWIA